MSTYEIGSGSPYNQIRSYSPTLEASPSLNQKRPLEFTDLIERPETNNYSKKRFQKGSASDNRVLQEIFLRNHGTNEDIKKHLGLDSWETEGDKDLAIKELVSCFRTQASSLNLRNFQLTSLPIGLKNFTWLTQVNIGMNPKLKNLYPLGKLTQLIELDLYGCNIHNLTFLNKLTSLKKLILSNNPNIHSFCIIETLKDLEILHLSSCNIFKISFIEKLYKLKELSLGENRKLYDLKPLRNLAQLNTLSLRKSNLCNIDTLKDLPSLKFLYLSQDPNTLKQLTDSSQNSIHLIEPKSSLGLLRKAAPNDKLKILDLRSFINSNPKIISWLERITNQNPYIPMPGWIDEQSRPAIAEKILEILHLAKLDPIFFEKIFLPLVDDSMTSCIDRTIYFLNEMVRQMELYQTKDLPFYQAVAVFNKYYPLSLVNEIAHESAEDRGLLHEEIEVQLDFCKRLSINLPFLDTEYTNLDWIKAHEEEINKAREKLNSLQDNVQKRIDYFCLNPFWQKRILQKHPELEKRLSTIEEEKFELLDELLTKYGNIKDAMNELEETHKQKIITLLFTATFDILSDFSP